MTDFKVRRHEQNRADAARCFALRSLGLWMQRTRLPPRAARARVYILESLTDYTPLAPSPRGKSHHGPPGASPAPLGGSPRGGPQGGWGKIQRQWYIRPQTNGTPPYASSFMLAPQIYYYFWTICSSCLGSSCGHPGHLWDHARQSWVILGSFWSHHGFSIAYGNSDGPCC
jgi:hypothetical protein